MSTARLNRHKVHRTIINIQTVFAFISTPTAGGGANLSSLARLTTGGTTILNYITSRNLHWVVSAV
jgi:hypothetical protein